MNILAKCNLEDARSFNGSLVILGEEGEKPDKVFLNVCFGSELSDEDINKSLQEVAAIGKSVMSVTVDGFRGGLRVPEALDGKVFCSGSLSEYRDATASEGTSISAVPLVVLEDRYCDMRELYSLSCSSETVRFIGGRLLGIGGVRIGRFDNKGKLPIYYDGVYDTFAEVDLHDLNGIKEIVKKSRKKLKSVDDSPKAKKASVKKSSKRVEVFNSLFGSTEEEEF